MKPTFAAAAAFVLATTSYVQAQPREGWIFRVEGLYSNQSSADLSGGSSFSVNRAFGRVGGFNRMSNACGDTNRQPVGHPVEPAHTAKCAIDRE